MLDLADAIASKKERDAASSQAKMKADLLQDIVPGYFWDKVKFAWDQESPADSEIHAAMITKIKATIQKIADGL